MDPRDARQARLRDKVESLHYRNALAGAAEQLSQLLGTTVSMDQALRQSAVDAARAALLRENQFHLVWRRVWGVHLREEMLEITRRLAEGAPERAILVWVWWDLQQKPVGAFPVAFEVRTASVLTQLPSHLGPPPGEVGPGGVGSDLLLVSSDGESGVHLDYQHHGDRDEYEMLVWGTYARPVLS